MNIKFLHKFSGVLLLMMVFCVFSYAQERRVTGKVVDQTDSSPLPGVNVSIKGRPSNVSTDANGAFSILIPAGAEQVLVFTYIGYTRQQISVVGKSTLNVSLTAANNSLNEVVVVGYGEQKKLTLTGAVSTIDVKKIEDLPNLNLSSSLSGQVPGLSVNTSSQRPGQPATLTIRQPVSLVSNGLTGTAPLYVIDDVIRTSNDFNLLDANEVENISILKDAEAAVYGIQGANGVVLVRTKRGKAGAPKISFSSSVGTATARQLPKMLSGYDLGTFLNDYNQTKAGQGLNSVTGLPSYIDANGYLNGNVNQKQVAWYTPDELAYFQQNNNNYLKQAFKTAYTEREAINVSGGTDRVTYFIGGDYVNQNSNFNGVNSNKYGLRATVEAKPAKGLSVSLNLNTEVQKSKSFWYKFAGTSESLDNDVTSLNLTQPWQKYFINGQPVLTNNANTAGGIDNINVFLFQNSNNYTAGTNYIINALGKITYEIPGIKGLTTSVSLNENYNNAWNQQYGTSFYYYRYSGLGDNSHIPGGTIVGNPINIKNGDRVSINPTLSTNYQLDATINYNRTFGKHTITFLGVYEQRELYNTGVKTEADGVIVGGKDNQNFTTGAQYTNQASSISNYGFISYIGRLNYSYADKYLFQLTTRIDGSSDFLPGKNYGYFPSASIGWVASNESFIKDKFSWIDLLKLRANVGLLGSDNTVKYQYQTSYKFGTGSGGGAVFNGQPRGLGITYNLALANPDITWDHSVKTEYGIDMQFLKNRLSISGDYYWNHGYDLLTSIGSSVPATVAATLPVQNYSVVNTFGYEISTGWRDHIGKNFSYYFTPFYSWYDNKNIRIDQTAGLIGTFQDLTGRSSDQGVLGYKYTGMIRTQADADAIIAQRQAAAGGASNVKINGTPIKDASGIYHLGMLNYQDLNGDGIIDTKDLQYLGHRVSNHNSLGLNFGGSYKALSLGVVMGMSWGGTNSISGYDRLTLASANPITENKAAYWSDHWTPSNPNAKYPNPYYSDDISLTSDYWFVSSFTWNITSMNLSYTLPTKLTSKVGISSARLYAVGYNLFSLYNPYPDHYRDTQTSINSYPAIRTVSLGLNIGF